MLNGGSKGTVELEGEELKNLNASAMRHHHPQTLTSPHTITPSNQVTDNI